MPKPTNQTTRKAKEACREIVRILRKHPEFDEHRPEQDMETRENPYTSTTVVTAHIRFQKYGKDIFQNTHDLEDYDFPSLVGGKLLRKAAQDAARHEGLKLNPKRRIYINPSEKGWVEVGYEFIHN